MNERIATVILRGIQLAKKHWCSGVWLIDPSKMLPSGLSEFSNIKAVSTKASELVTSGKAQWTVEDSLHDQEDESDFEPEGVVYTKRQLQITISEIREHIINRKRMHRAIKIMKDNLYLYQSDYNLLFNSNERPTDQLCHRFVQLCCFGQVKYQRGNLDELIEQREEIMKQQQQQQTTKQEEQQQHQQEDVTAGRKRRIDQIHPPLVQNTSGEESKAIKVN